MMNKSRLVWIEQGYELVAMNGIKSLNVEVLARIVSKNKSSFYHFFGDMELFETELLDYHLESTKQFAERASSCKTLKPEIISLMVESKDDLFFHKQLRINRNKPEYKACFDKSFEMFQSAVFEKWVDFLDLRDKKSLASAFLNLATENFLLRITYDLFTYEWLENYLQEFSEMMQNINHSTSSNS